MMALLLMQQLVLWCGRCCCVLLLALLLLLLPVLLLAVRLLLVLLVMLQAWQLSVSPAPVFIINARETRLLRKAVAPALGKARHALRQVPAKASYVVPGADRFES